MSKPITVISENLVFLTPCFAQGHKGQPELTSSAIKGMLRLWCRRTLPEKEIEIFGVADGKNISKSKIIVRSEVIEPTTQTFPVCAHKPNKIPKQAFPANTEFKVILLAPEELSDAIKTIFNALVQYGGIGFRKNRAAGSIWFKKQPESMQPIPLINDFTVKHLTSSNSAVELMEICSDTLAPQALNFALGNISSNPPSPIEFKVVKEDNQFKLLAVYPASKKASLKEAGRILKQRNKRLGPLLVNL